MERHEAASEKLADEIDIVKLLYVHRVGQFLAKLILNKHQRVLVTSFKKYQIDDLRKTIPVDAEEMRSPRASLLRQQPTIQEDDGPVSDFNAFANDERLTEDQLKLLKEIADQFTASESAADMSILYETTGFQADCEELAFWENYQDFEELGESKLARQDKDEKFLASNKTPKTPKKQVIPPDDVDSAARA